MASRVLPRSHIWLTSLTRTLGREDAQNLPGHCAKLDNAAEIAKLRKMLADAGITDPKPIFHNRYSQ